MQAEWLTLSPIAHRGLWDTAEFPENSLAAFRKAVALGIPFELDVQLTRDGQLAVVHDTDLERLTGKPCAVADLDLADLKRLRIGDTGERIPLLAEVLEIAAGVPFVIDVRQWRGPRTGAIEEAVVAAVRDYDGPFALQSFDPLAVLRMRRLAEDHPVGQASGNLRSAGRLARMLGRPMFTNAVTRPSFISYELSALPSSWVRFWRRLGIPVLAWTVRSLAMEKNAVRVADNFFFDEYLPHAYAGDLSLRRDPPPSRGSHVFSLSRPAPAAGYRLVLARVRHPGRGLGPAHQDELRRPGEQAPDLVSRQRDHGHRGRG